MLGGEDAHVPDPITMVLLAYAIALPITLGVVLPFTLRAAIRRHRDPLPWFLAAMIFGPLALAICLYPARPAARPPMPIRTPGTRIPRGRAMRPVACPLCGEANEAGHVCHPARVADRIHRRVVTRVGELPYIQ